MFSNSTFSALLGALIVGSLDLVTILAVIFVFQTDEPRYEPLKQLLDLIKSHAGWLAGAFTATAILVGLLLDSIGHVLVDRFFQSKRSKLVSSDVRKFIERKAEENEPLGFDSLVQSVFYANAPSHLLNYHSEQWAYYEFYRNLLVSLVVFVIGGCAICVRVRACTYLCMILAVGVFFWVVLLCLLRWVVRYYYNIEGFFTADWLRESSSK